VVFEEDGTPYQSFFDLLCSLEWMTYSGASTALIVRRLRLGKRISSTGNNSAIVGMLAHIGYGAIFISHKTHP
jgi:hypothetical protein